MTMYNVQILKVLKVEKKISRKKYFIFYILGKRLEDNRLHFVPDWLAWLCEILEHVELLLLIEKRCFTFFYT